MLQFFEAQPPFGPAPEQYGFVAEDACSSINATALLTL